VRVHTDTEANPMSKKVNASAFTAGQGIYFQSGKFGPNSQTGPELLAHEDIRTVQQSKGQVSSGSITGARWAEAKSAVGNGPGPNMWRAVMESPQSIGEVLGETWESVKEHRPVLLETTVALVGAALLIGGLPLRN
jgi:hypothetical protein